MTSTTTPAKIARRRRHIVVQRPDSFVLTAAIAILHAADGKMRSFHPRRQPWLVAWGPRVPHHRPFDDYSVWSAIMPTV
jgi:hypothetical protein